MRKPHRKGAMAMEKLAATSSKYRTQFWYVAMASFLLWICLLYLFNSSATTVHNHERLFREDTTDLVVPKRHELDQVTLVGSDDSSVDNNSLSVTGGTSRDQVLEDAKVVNDIVEELENEKLENEKKRGELISRARKGRRDSPLKETESRKSRSSSRFEPDRKRIRRNVDSNVESSENQSLDKEPNYFESKNKERVDKAFDGNNGEEQLIKDFSEDDPETDNNNEQKKHRSKRGKELTNDSDFEDDNSVELLQKDQRRKVSNRKNKPARSRRVIVRPRRTRANDPCAGKYVYMHEIPTLFNEELLKNCWTLSRWTDMCELTSNFGLGPRLSNLEGVSGWFATNQFTLEVIFHNRMKQYKCLTKDSSLASAVYVPYYPGLDLMRFLWGPFPTMRDAGALDLMKWLRKKPEWEKMDGRDHFMVAGRTTWDFMRTPENDTDWGNRLMILPESKNMTMLLIESSPWNYHGFAVPYPTYFHPSSNGEILQWQNRMRRIRRRYLFSFVGAPRPNLGDSIRSEIMDQCKASRRKCKLLECVKGSQKCYKPDQIMKFFLSSTFCLQPPGDSYTRRSTFDSILAGCIPVFFHPGSAYAQYIWHLPKNIEKYSVFIPGKSVKEGKASIERILSRIPRAKVIAMREEVIKLIPRLMYFNPSAKRRDTGRFEDAFDVAVQGVLERVEGIRRGMEEGKEELFDFPEEFSWKYNVFGNVKRHEWDSYFERP